MTTEDDFQAALDANPDDHHTRLVFADWLQERGDPRAEGYRALGTLRISPRYQDYSRAQEEDIRHWRWVYDYDLDDVWAKARMRKKIHYAHVLPAAWTALASPTGTALTLGRATRREVEDVAATAFAKMLPKTWAELLAATKRKRKR
jgi:uncharacterized protein (TIGR02996 family)